MKKLLIQSAVLFVVAISVFASCKKVTQPNVSRVPSGTIQTKYNLVGIPSDNQVFVMNTKDLPTTITTLHGTSIQIPADAIMLNGLPATGELTITVEEYFTKADMIGVGIHTMNNVNILISDGSYHITATINGIPADNELAGGKNFVISFSSANKNPDDKLFEGEIATAPVEAIGQFNWLENTGTLKSDGVTTSFEWGKLGWINCDVFYSTITPLTNVRINLPNNPGDIAKYQREGDTYVFFVPKGINTVVQLYTSNDNSQVRSYDNSMPVGMEGRLISFCIKGKKCWFAKKDIVITPDMEETLTLAETNKGAIQNEISKLNNY